MFTAYYDLKFNPFSKDIDPKHRFKSESFLQALNRLEFLKQTRGFGVVSGNPGSGKSFLMRYFTQTLNPNLFKSVYIPLSTLTVMEFYRALCHGLGVSPHFKKVDMFKQIQESVYSYHQSKNVVPVIILDEAQFLKNSILDDLRIIFNFSMDSKDYSILIFSGQTQFIERLNRQNHEALRQRIAVNYYLGGLSREETVEYVNTRLKLAGRTESIFQDDAFELLYSSTNGCIRSLNLLAKMCLIHGANEQLPSIGAETVFQAQTELNITA